jgi:LemA protein
MVNVSIVAAVIAIAVAVAVVRVFNRLVAARNACDSARGGIDVQLEKRHDLVPNLTRVVEGYTVHERTTLVAVTEARAAAVTALGTNVSARAEDRLEHALAALFAQVESYPTLKASDNFLHLQRTLTEIEEQLAAARRAFNAHALVLNNLTEQFPTSIVAQLTSIGRVEFFAASEQVRG